MRVHVAADHAGYELKTQLLVWLADNGYQQVKTYMSIKPGLVPLIADHAHARGLHVSGHVPAYMSAPVRSTWASWPNVRLRWTCVSRN